MFVEHPLTGVGRGNYYGRYPDYARRVDPSMPSGTLGAHSTPLAIAAETGLLGLTAWAAKN